MDYEKDVGAYVWDWKFRCPECNLSCSSRTDIDIHKSLKYKEEKPQVFEGRLVDKAVRIERLKKKQGDRPKVTCVDRYLENVFWFKYLVSIFSVNANQMYDN